MKYVLISRILNLIVKKQMPAKTFLDSNIILYSVSNDPKKKYALSLMQSGSYISTQVLTECANVCLKKLKFPEEKTTEIIMRLEGRMTTISVSPEMIVKAIAVSARYRFHFYDSLIIAAAILSGCDTLYSEDMHHGQVIEGVKITNPFLGEEL